MEEGFPRRKMRVFSHNNMKGRVLWTELEGVEGARWLSGAFPGGELLRDQQRLSLISWGPERPLEPPPNHSVSRVVSGLWGWSQHLLTSGAEVQSIWWGAGDGEAVPLPDFLRVPAASFTLNLGLFLCHAVSFA